MMARNGKCLGDMVAPGAFRGARSGMVHPNVRSPYTALERLRVFSQVMRQPHQPALPPCLKFGCERFAKPGRSVKVLRKRLDAPILRNVRQKLLHTPGFLFLLPL